MAVGSELVARKTVTYIQDGSVFKERWLVPGGTEHRMTARMVFKDSTGADIVEIEMERMDERYVYFACPYETVAQVPNGAGFYCYLNDARNPHGEDMLVWGSVFRRELEFPNSPATTIANTPRIYEDTFQRPAGGVGGRWNVLVGRPRIFSNDGWLTGDAPNTVGPAFNFFSRYYMRYYKPMASDSVELSIACVDKGQGRSYVTLCGNRDATAFLFVEFKSLVGAETATLGWGTGPDVGSWLDEPDGLNYETEPANVTVTNTALTNFKIRYNDTTKVLGLYNDDYTETFLEWVDSENFMPHGKGYRYFGVAGNSTLLDSGVQLSYLRAMDVA